MAQKTKRISQDQVGSLIAVFTDYLKLRARVDIVNADLERFHTRLTRTLLKVVGQPQRTGR